MTLKKENKEYRSDTDILNVVAKVRKLKLCRSAAIS